MVQTKIYLLILTLHRVVHLLVVKVKDDIKNCYNKITKNGKNICISIVWLIMTKGYLVFWINIKISEIILKINFYWITSVHKVWFYIRGGGNKHRIAKNHKKKKNKCKHWIEVEIQRSILMLLVENKNWS